jgi:hypothetical protein
VPVIAGLHPSARERRAQDWRNTVLEVICVIVVIAALVALAAWFVFNHGGAQGAAGPF